MIKFNELNFVYSRNNLGKPIVFLWADALRDFVDRSSSNTPESKSSTKNKELNNFFFLFSRSY